MCVGGRGQAAEQSGMAIAYERMLEGFAAYEAKEYDKAAELLTAALRTHALPTVAYCAGRAEEERGRWVEAAELYERAQRLAPSGDVESQAKHRQAQKDAGSQLSQLQERIPRLWIRVQSASVAEVSVSLGGVTLGAETLREAVLLNPGQHEVVGQCREQAATEPRVVVVEEGKTEQVELEVPCVKQGDAGVRGQVEPALRRPTKGPGGAPKAREPRGMSRSASRRCWNARRATKSSPSASHAAPAPTPSRPPRPRSWPCDTLASCWST